MHKNNKRIDWPLFDKHTIGNRMVIRKMADKKIKSFISKTQLKVYIIILAVVIFVFYFFNAAIFLMAKRFF